MSSSEITLATVPNPKWPKTVCGWFGFGLVKTPILGVAALNGVISKAGGKTWKQGFDELNQAADKHITDPVSEFCDRHNTAILHGAGSAAAIAAVAKKKDPDESKAKTVATAAAVGAATAAGKAFVEEKMAVPPGPSGTSV
jgi:hypothetical protein